MRRNWLERAATQSRSHFLPHKNVTRSILNYSEGAATWKQNFINEKLINQKIECVCVNCNKKAKKKTH